MPELPDCRLRQHGAFTTAQARAAGLSAFDLGSLVRAGLVVRLMRGAYAEAQHVDRLTRIERSITMAVAACLVHPGTALSHHSAALVHGLPLLGSFPARPSLSADLSHASRGTSGRAAALSRVALPAHHVEQRDRWAVTTGARTAVDLARRTGALSGLVALDAALHLGRATAAAVAEVVSRCARWPGVSAMDLVLARADGRAESPAESIARWRLIELGLEPVPQVWAYDDRGPIGCGDLWLARERVFLEVDGDVKYTTYARATTLLDEKRRQERIEAAGFGVARVAARQADDSTELSTRVGRAARAGEARRSAQHVTGRIGPPPSWAIRGSEIA